MGSKGIVMTHGAKIAGSTAGPSTGAGLSSFSHSKELQCRSFGRPNGDGAGGTNRDWDDLMVVILVA